VPNRPQIIQPLDVQIARAVTFDTGAAQNAREDWPAPAWDAFPRNVYGEEHHLDNALAAVGYGIGDIRAVVMGQLHLDQAGGLEKFAGRDVPSTPTSWKSSSIITPWPPGKISAPTCRGT
jgi:glyoxylase-like metal-dependent hydrolase (beta-lactamase superfamily II)